jgi:hypothetical protein
MSIGLKSDSSGTSGSIVINGSDAVLVTPTGITTASIQNSSITTAKIADANITFGKLSTSATEADNVASRTAKAWVNFDGTTNTGGNCTIRSDFNVSTVADNGDGDYTVNFSTALANANYATQVTGSTPTSALPNTTGYVGVINTSTSPSTNAISILFHHPGVGNKNSEYANVSVFST